MKKEKSWLEEIEFDPNLDYQLEPDDNYRNYYDEEVRFPSDLKGGRNV
jgi:hypothetical protein